MPSAQQPLLLPGVLKPKQRRQRLDTANYLRPHAEDDVHDVLIRSDINNDGSQI